MKILPLASRNGFGRGNKQSSTTPNGVRQFENVSWMLHGQRKYGPRDSQSEILLYVLIMRNQFMYIAYLLHIWMVWANRPPAQWSWTSWYQENLFPVFCKAIYVVVPALQVCLLFSGIKFKAGRHSGLVKDHDWDTRDTWFKSCLGAVFSSRAGTHSQLGTCGQAQGVHACG